MALHILPILRPVLFGSMVLLMSTSCQRADRSAADDNTPPLREPTSDLENKDEQSRERIHVTGKDEPAPAPLREPTSDLESGKEERMERIHVTGKDKETIAEDEGLDLDVEQGAMAGTAGSGGSSGSK